jgi:hypothetical protein
MHLDEPRARIAHQGSAMTRAKQMVLKAVVVVGGAVMLVSAFVLSVAFLVIGLAVVLTVGGYLWWHTRALRRQLRERMQEQLQPWADREVIEGEVISQDRTRR